MKQNGKAAPERELTYAQILRQGILTKNPVLVQAIGVCPIAAVASSTKVAIILAAVSGALLILGEILGSTLYKYIPRWLRVGIYGITFVAAVVPMSMMTEKYMPNIYISVGVFLPLMAVNSLLVYRCDGFAVHNPLRKSVVDALAYSVGYALVIVAVGAIREILGKGMFWELSVTRTPPVPAVDTPFGGFLVLAFLSAALWFVLYRRDRTGRAGTLEDSVEEELDEEQILSRVKKVSAGVVETAVGVSTGIDPNAGEHARNPQEEGGADR